MTALLLAVAGLLLLAASGAAAARREARRRQRDQKLAGRLRALRPDAPVQVGGHILFGPETGPRALRVRFARADLHLQRRPGVIAAVLVLAAAAGAAVLGRPLLGAGVVLAAAAGALAVLEVVAARNVRALLRDLPFFLDGLRQQMAVGASLTQALGRGVEQASPDVRRYFLPMVRRMQNGATVVEGLVWLSARLALSEIDMLVLAVQTNTRFGGKMSPTLGNIASVLREQARVTRELKAATAETRFSAWVLAGLPPLVIVFISLTNPAYAELLTGSASGRAMVATAAALQLAGCLVVMRIRRLDF